MTPSQILKTQIAQLSTVLNNNGFETINLNKSQPKDLLLQNVDDEYLLSFPGEESTNYTHLLKKEVKTDFLKMFKAKTKNEKYSVGLHFYFLDEIDDNKSTIQISLKTTSKFMITEELSLTDAKLKITELSKILSNKDVDETFSLLQNYLNLDDKLKNKKTHKKSP